MIEALGTKQKKGREKEREETTRQRRNNVCCRAEKLANRRFCRAEKEFRERGRRGALLALKENETSQKKCRLCAQSMRGRSWKKAAAQEGPPPEEEKHEARLSFSIQRRCLLLLRAFVETWGGGNRKQVRKGGRSLVRHLKSHVWLFHQEGAAHFFRRKKREGEGVSKRLFMPGEKLCGTRSGGRGERAFGRLRARKKKGLEKEKKGGGGESLRGVKR